MSRRLLGLMTVLVLTCGTIIGAEGIAGAMEVNQVTATAAAPAPSPALDVGATMSVLLSLAAVGAIALLIAAGWHRLDRAPRRPMLFTPVVGIALMLAMVVLQMIGAEISRAIFGIQPPSDGAAATGLPNHARIMFGAYAAQAIVVGLYVSLLISARRPERDHRRHPVAAVVIGLGALILFWPIVQLAGAGASFVHTWLTGEPAALIAHSTLAQLVEAPGDRWRAAVIALVLIGAPIMEELLYRGLAQETLRRMGVGPWTAIMAASAIFAVMHLGAVPLHAVVPLLVLSLGFGWVYEKTGRLLAPISMHAAFNGANLAFALWAASPGGG